MSSDYSRAYSKGYAAASRGKWPGNKPPIPPLEVVANILKAAKRLRDDCDWYVSTIDPDDEIAKMFGALIDEMDKRWAAYEEWIRKPIE